MSIGTLSKSCINRPLQPPGAWAIIKCAEEIQIDCQMVVYKRKNKGRKDLTATGESARKCKHSRSNAALEKESWLLATSLTPSTSKFAKKITRIYQSGMQIEESFRDLKTGLDFNISNTRKQKRLDVLLLIVIRHSLSFTCRVWR